MNERTIRPGSRSCLGLGCGCLLLAFLGAACRGGGERHEWAIEAGQGGFGIVTSIVRCGDVAYLADSHQKIHRFSVGTSRLLEDLPVKSLFATAMAADCAGRVLYVVTTIPFTGKTGTVYAFDLDSAELRREYTLLPNFLPRYGARLATPDTLVLGGLWVPPDRSPDALLEVDAADYYQGLKLGVSVSLSTGDVAPLEIPYENKCIGAGECPEVRLDAIATPAGVRHVASLPTSSRIGVHDPGAKSPRLIDITSPRFVRNSEVLQPNAHVEDRIRWTGKNSTISRVIAFSEVVAVVHCQSQIGPDWRFGQLTQTTCFMNSYGWDGSKREVDVPVFGGFNMGSDEKNLYAVDYGSEGVRDGAAKITLVQIPIAR